MRKLLSLIFAITLVLTLFATPAFAGPAAPLTDVQFYAVTSDGNNYNWEIIYNEMSPTIPLTGTEGVFAIYLEGYENPSSFRIYNNGIDITSKTYEPIPPDYYTDSYSVVYAKMVYKAFNLSDVSTGNFTVQATSINYPFITWSDQMYESVNPS